MRTIIHVGPSNQIPGSRTGPKLREDTKYICFEPDEKWSNRGYKELSLEERKQVEIIPQEWQEANIKPKSIDEVHMHNVIGDSKIDSRSFLGKAYHILKPKGILYIGESYSPPSFENIANKARETKFDLDVIVPYPLDHITEQEYKRFKEIYKENTNSEKYNENFDEWYPLIGKMKLLFDQYRLNEAEKETFNRVKGEFATFMPESYLLKLTK